MNDELLMGQENYDPMEYQESYLEEDYDDDEFDGSFLEYEENEYEENEYEEDEDDDDYYLEESELAEGRRRRSMTIPSWLRKPKKRGSRVTQRGRRYPRPRAVVPKKRYFKPPTRNRPADTKTVVKAFGKASADIRNTRVAVQKVNNDNKIQQGQFTKAINVQDKRISGTEYALAATTIVAKLQDDFPKLFENDAIKAVVQLAPQFLQKPKKQEFYKDPRVIATIATAGIALFKEFSDKNNSNGAVKSVTISPPFKTLIAGSSSKFEAVARDNNNLKIEGTTLKWYSSNDAVATVDNTGNLIGINAGTR